MRRPFLPRSIAIVLTAGALLLGSLALAGGVTAATKIATTTTCSNDYLTAVAGLGVICEVTVVNRITTIGGSATVTVHECHGPAGPAPVQTDCSTKTTTLGQPVTKITQCNGSINGGGTTLRCSVKVTNDFVGLNPGATPATVNQCDGSAGGGGTAMVCDPFPATTTGATITQCNGTATGGGGSLTCTATGTKSSALSVKINQCNGSSTGGGDLVICSANITNRGVSNFRPSNGSAGTVVTINGSGFTGATAVKFHGRNAHSFTVISNTRITAVVAAGTTSGTISVTGPGGTGSSAQTFVVTTAGSTGPTPTAPATSVAVQPAPPLRGIDPLVPGGMAFLAALTLVAALTRYRNRRELR